MQAAPGSRRSLLKGHWEMLLFSLAVTRSGNWVSPVFPGIFAPSLRGWRLRSRSKRTPKPSVLFPGHWLVKTLSVPWSGSHHLQPTAPHRRWCDCTLTPALPHCPQPVSGSIGLPLGFGWCPWCHGAVPACSSVAELTSGLSSSFLFSFPLTLSVQCPWRGGHSIFSAPTLGRGGCPWQVPL